jgi:flagellar assembly protein FliH
MRANGTTIDPADQDITVFSYSPGSAAQSAAADLVFPELGSTDHTPGPYSAAVSDPAEMQASFERRVAEETARSFAEGRARGMEEARMADHQAQHAIHSQESTARATELARLVQQFATERDRYLERIETEVVRLALAIAARILRREAQTDPLLLLGAVRVALGQLAGATRLRLRVPATHASLWKDAVALLPSRAARPEIVSDEAMRLGECALESELGSVDLAVPAQLAEIERRLFTGAADLAPQPAPDSAVEVEA